jgi:hypothetical protein
VIRAWLSTARRRAPSVPSKPVDPAVFLGAQFDLKDAQIEGLRDALAEAQRQLSDERRRSAVLVGQLATYKAREWPAHAARLRRRLAEEPTTEVTAHQLARSRPMDAPTEQWRTR